MNNRKLFFNFFLIPFIIFIIFSYLIYQLNNHFLKQSFEKTTTESKIKIGNVYRIALLNAVDDISMVENNFFQKDDIVYYAIRNSQKELVTWKTKYEGFLPIFTYFPKETIDLRKVNSPIGDIHELNIKYFKKAHKTEYTLTLGFREAYTILAKRGYLRYFLIVVLLIALVMFFYYLRITKYHISTINKQKTLLNEKREKEYFQNLSVLSFGIAHEIKNPLNTLSLILENISLLNKDSKETRELIKDGEEEIDTLLRLTKSFALLLKKEKKYDLSWELVKFDLIRVAKNSIRITNNSYSNSITFKAPLKDPLFIHGNSDLVLIMINNLLKNSCEASGPKGSIILEINCDSNQIPYIKVEDTGQGSAEELIELQKPFNSKKRGSLGIGLHIINKILAFHDWTSKIENSESGIIYKVIIEGVQQNE